MRINFHKLPSVYEKSKDLMSSLLANTDLGRSKQNLLLLHYFNLLIHINEIISYRNW